MTNGDEQLEAQLRARPLPGLSDEARRRLLAELASVTVDNSDRLVTDLSDTHALTNWKRIMRHPVTRVAAAVILVLAIAGVALLFHGGGTTPAFADFVQPILKAKTVKYKVTTKWTSLSAGMTGLTAEMQKELLEKGTTDEVMMLGASRVRTVSQGLIKTVYIWDGSQRKSLLLQPEAKLATVTNYADMPADKARSDRDPMAGIRSLLLDARDTPGIKRESLGEKVIDGCRAIGFRIRKDAAVLDLWGDPKTGAPIRIETSSTLIPNIMATMSDFVFNAEMDESLFSVEPPAGYEVTVIQGHNSDASPEEKDLIAMFRCYGQWSGGRFPDLLEMTWINEKTSLAEWMAANINQPPMAQRQQESADRQAKLQRGMTFVVSLPKEADVHYAGKGVSLGATHTPVFWYRPKDAKKYRVIYADLTVHESDTPPSMPDVPAAQMERDLIDMFRQYSALNGGSFPDALDTVSFLSIVQTRKGYFALEKPPRKPSAKEEQEIAEALTTFLRALTFIELLPKDADAHYAGKGVSLGAADTPIYWYRPKDAKVYRVIYANLSVHEANAPPPAPVRLPEQDLVNALRYYSELSGGPFPSSLEPGSILQMASLMAFAKFHGGEGQQPSQKQIQEMTRTVKKLQPGLEFAGSLPPKADAHYAGRAVSLGAADTPIFWYRPEDAKKYRVIYADLSVREADAAPAVPVARPEQDLIDALRYHSQLSGGTFPHSLDMEGLLQPLEKKFGLEKGQQPDAKQWQEALEATLRVQPGVAFIASLPPEADAHYAGKAVSLGAAGTPIFWYRPKDAKKCQVIYADLSVRTADTAPSVPNAQAVPGPLFRPKK
jgi:hypothetical protein